MNPNSNPILELKDIRVSFQKKEILHGVSLALEKGGTLGLVGGSGSGKSTTALVAAGLIPQEEGSVLLNGAPLPARRTKEQRRQVQMIFQNPDSSLNPRHTIFRILSEGMLFHGLTDREHAREKVDALVRLMHLPEETPDRYPRSFSGGQKQRIAIARALSLEPSVLIADEPTSALDVSVQKDLLDLLEEVRKERGLTMLFISHDLGVIARMCGRVALMQDGRILETKTTEDFFRAPDSDYGRELLAAVPVLPAAPNKDEERSEAPCE